MSPADPSEPGRPESPQPERTGSGQLFPAPGEPVYDWLYRGEDRHAVPPPPVDEPTLRRPTSAAAANRGELDDTSPGTSRLDDTVTDQEPVQPVDRAGPAVPPPFVPPPEEYPTGVKPARSRVWLLVGALLLAAVLGGGVVAAVLLLAAPRAEQPAPSSTAVPSTPAAPTSSAAPQAARAITPTAARAGCVAPDAVEANGQPVGYAPTNLIDRNANSVWKCNGAAVGQEIELQLPPGSTVSEVAMVNGYAAADPTTGAQRYPEYRRITTVIWTFPNQNWFRQTLVDGVPSTQTMTISPQQADSVRIRIETTTSPGSSDPTRDAVVIPEVSVGG